MDEIRLPSDQQMPPEAPIRTYTLSPEELERYGGAVRPTKADLVAAAEKGLTVEDVAEQHNVTPKWVQVLCARHQIEPRLLPRGERQEGPPVNETPPELNAEAIKQMMRQHPDEGFDDVARAFGYASPGSFAKRVKALGVSISELRRELGLPDPRTFRTAQEDTAPTPPPSTPVSPTAAEATPRPVTPKPPAQQQESYSLTGRWCLVDLIHKLEALQYLAGADAQVTATLEFQR